MFQQLNIVFLATVTIFVLVDSKLGHHDHSLGIIGGKEATPHESPSTVRLFIVSENSAGQEINGHCGATLISEKDVLTAKHCIVGMLGVYVFIGDHNRTKTEPGEELQVAYLNNVTQHQSLDVAIIHLNESVTYSQTIRSASLPLRKDANEDYVGQTGTAYGWGLTHDKGKRSEVLMKVDVTVVGNTECQARPYALCTSGNNATDPVGTCVGDSGGPFFINNVLVGVTYSGDRDCETGGYSVYVRTGLLLDWIEQNTDLTLP